MKQLIYIINISLMYMSCHATETPPTPPIVIHLNNNTNNSNQNTAQADVAISFYQWIKNYSASQKDYIQSLWQTLKEHIIKNKWTYGLYSCGISYAIIIMYLQSLDYFLDDQTAWHNWPHGLSSEQLLSYNHQDIVQWLIKAIKEQYFNNQNPLEQVDCFITFFNQIAQEKKRLTQGIYIIYWLEKCWLSKLPFIKTTRQEIMHKKESLCIFLCMISC